MAIRNRFAILIAERGIKATDVSIATGIARSTLSSLANHREKMIAFKTIDRLCRYLHITPGEFFDFDPHPTSDHWYLTKSKGR